MAKVSFTTGEGEQKSYKLVSHRPIRIGRDPGNDVILRDAKVSRSHAEIVFERGFYVLHDLASANGSFVNGVKVRVAPLTDGAQLKLGGSHGFFTEELPDSPSLTSMADPKAPAAEAEAATPDKSAPAPAQASSPPAPPSLPTVADSDTSNEGEDQINTAPQPKESIEKLLRPGATSPGPRDTQKPAPDADPESREAVAPENLVVDPWSAGDRLAVRRDDGTPLLFYRRPPTVINLIANLLAGLVFLTGSAVTFFLLSEKIILPSALAALLTAVFTLLIVGLTPRRSLTLYDDEQYSSRAMLIRQDKGFPLPRIRFRAEAGNGEPIGAFERNRLIPLARRTWRIGTERGEHGLAREKQWSDVLLRFLTANFVAAFRPQYDFTMEGVPYASLERRDQAMLVHYLAPSSARIDPRLPLALALVVNVLDR